MSSMLRIRKEILKLTQAEVAAIAGVQQGTVSRWERGELEPARDQIAAILDAARARGIPLEPADFFDAPDPVRAQQTGAVA